ncbi:Prenylated Rab acceptor protein 1 [Neocucurbitaria cava]|uniref:Prenylated Rab acceptor protein 1 n=1 Tax=Neocucurbitaria cava TaxID=798079 RepID=A0A9W9CQB8_9PLEO|nr:Prenylated Rab acceptor protein 1 [Neocucurbitaria cava]
MAGRISSLLLLGASAIVASPLVPRQSGAATVTVSAAEPTSTAWDAGATREYPIHASCNATQQAYIKNGLEETITICRQARDHILRWGNSSEIYQKYFGDAATGEPLGWYEKVVSGDRADILFRCDNIDGNCAQEGWAGHWRGSNATGETVICDLSYESRLPLEGMCMFGYNVANSPANTFWASDLLHRLFHLPKVGEGAVGHYGAEAKYSGVLDLAKEKSTYAGRNSDTLQYFALEVYAHDIAVPGIGCPGTYIATPTASAEATSEATVAASSAVVMPSEAIASTTAAAEACTPHEDHW